MSKEMSHRKGIILAGGSGSRLQPMTGVISKQILPVYDKPMIYYPLSVLMLAGIKEILIISTNEHLPQIRHTIIRLGPIGVNFEFMVQQLPRGIAEAMILAENFLDGSASALILGDNMFFGHNLSETLKQAKKVQTGARIFVCPVDDPERYGVLQLDEKKKIIKIIEKPNEYISNLAVTGLYFYDTNAPSMARQLEPSQRGELEITDLNLAYLDRNQLSYHNFGRGFAWLDAGTPASLLDASNFVSTVERRQGIKIAVPEEVALNNGWITPDEIVLLPNALKNNDYAKYLISLARRI